ncbi:MAG: pullulanase-type alpha-1,6-glucosidase [Natronospirillum sp.]
MTRLRLLLTCIATLFVFASPLWATDLPRISGLYEPYPNEAVIYYNRADGDYEGWGLHLWDDDSRSQVPGELAQGGTAWSTPQLPSGISETYGAYYVVQMASTDWSDFMFVVHRGEEKDLGGLDHRFDRARLGHEVFTFQGVSNLYSEAVLAPPIEIEGASAHWVAPNTLVFDEGAAAEVQLFYSPIARLEVDEVSRVIRGATDSVTLTWKSMPEAIARQFPHLAHRKAWMVPSRIDTKQWLKGQLVVGTFDVDGRLETATQVQTPGVIDAVYADRAEQKTLGALPFNSGTVFQLWAPTAQRVSLYLYDDDLQLLERYPLREDPTSGVWSHLSRAAPHGTFYRYEVTTYHPDTRRIETFRITDPYSQGLSTNSLFSQVVFLDHPSLQPTGWADNRTDHVVAAPEDIVLYELQVRDFSVADQHGTPELNGKYLAFTEAERASVQHLQKLRDAGLTHIHLMPTFDIATINEDPTQVVNINDTFARLCAINPSVADSRFADYCTSDRLIMDILGDFDSSTPDAQAVMQLVRNHDSFNWGYDPLHYNVPEGSFATDANGMQRILEYRQMVQALHDMGFSVVVDVVYNHTNAAGLHPKSVLDKAVPGYYHRRNPDSGAVETSTCCMNTATEHRMMEKLMTDSLVLWAEQYHIDAFRFDLMGHHMREEVMRSLVAVRNVRPHVYFYGEGWDFGEVANNQRGQNATQWNMPGSGIGTFSDRLRDAVRGGSPFDEQEGLRISQGFANGLYFYPNELRPADDHARQELLHLTDLIRLGMAANLQNFQLVSHEGFLLRGRDYDYRGAPAGYALDPQEVINYVSKHDNQTLWDNNQYRMARGVSTDDRVRMQMVGLSLPMLSQGVPFFHAGSDLLRSKSMERDSYDSGDWVNRIDWTGDTHNWNIGLPSEEKDAANWPMIQQIIADPHAAPTAEHIAHSAELFREFLQIRQSSPLFRLRTQHDVMSRVDFRNTGPNQAPGLIVMTLHDGQGVTDLDPERDALMVIVNVSTQARTLRVPGFRLHRVQQEGADTRLHDIARDDDLFVIPHLSTVVLEQPQQGAPGRGMPVARKDTSMMPPFGGTRLYLQGSLTGMDSMAEEHELRFVGNGRYEMTITMPEGFHRIRIGGNDGLQFARTGGPLQLDTDFVLSERGTLMVLRIVEETELKVGLDASDATAPVLHLTAP